MRKSFSFLAVIALFSFAFLDPSVAQRPGGGAGGAGRPGAAGGGQGRGRSPAGGVDAGALTFRSIGPAVTSGRVIAFAVNPEEPTTYYVAVASGGVWKTTNNGTTFAPIFDNENSYSIGAITLDPNNPNIVWVGTGELNGQRSVGYGDGVYRSEDGGKSWKNVGLPKSEHIGKIVVDPNDSNTVYVAAQGPLWGPGGERGLYKTVDGGKTWKNVLSICENTGVTDVVVDPRNSDIIYAASWQRRRHFFTYVGGGPESGIQRSNDGGATWTKLRSGLPGGDIGRIGLAISPADPKMIYATVESAAGGGGTYRSTDYGASWEKRGDFLAQGMYYGQIIADPKEAERIYILSVANVYSIDGGKTVLPVGEQNKHVDNHALWIDPANTKHLLAGCDGGVYESFDRGTTWIFKSNLPIAQFYRIAVDNSKPYYFVYGGTQDNNSIGGPTRSKSPTGVGSAEWFVTNGGDGFGQQVDPEDPNTVYSESQDGGLVRFDRKTSLRMGIQPVPGRGEKPYRFYWDSPIIISPHSHTRLYFGGNKLFKSDDRGDNWTAISPDLSREIDRNTLKVMGKIQPLEAIARGQSTSFYGNIISITESPKQEGVIYVGTDDGLIQITEDGGKNWRKIESVPGVPINAYVGRLLASQHDANIVYALFDNHKNYDFAPYIYRSGDRGKTWVSISTNLPTNGPTLSIAEDFIDANLLFVGTEFGLFNTKDGGKAWTRMRSGLPTISVRDIVIQKRENDLVVGTFGRGIYVLDDYSSMRQPPLDPKKDGDILPIKNTTAYIPYSGTTGSQGETMYYAPNPPYGALINYRLKEAPKTLKQKRQDVESELVKKGETVPYVTPEQLRSEAEEDPSALTMIISDKSGNLVRRLTAADGAGAHRVVWDLRGDASLNGGYSVMPGEYQASLSRRVNNVTAVIVPPVTFQVTAQEELALTANQQKLLLDFREKVAKLQRAYGASVETLDTLIAKAAAAKTSAQDAPKATDKLRQLVLDISKSLREIEITLRGDGTAATLVQPEPVNLARRMGEVTFGQIGSPYPPSVSLQQRYKEVSEDLGEMIGKLKRIATVDMPKLDKALDAAGAPHTSGRLPDWK